MKKLLFIIVLLLIGLVTCAQDYEIQYHPKVKQAFTTENIDSIEVTVKKLQHPTDTVYYKVSQWTTVVIFPKTKLVGIKEEETK